LISIDLKQTEPGWVFTSSPSIAVTAEYVLGQLDITRARIYRISSVLFDFEQKRIASSTDMYSKFSNQRLEDFCNQSPDLIGIVGHLFECISLVAPEGKNISCFMIPATGLSR